MEVAPPIVTPMPKDNLEMDIINKESKYELNFENKKYSLILNATKSNFLTIKLREKDEISSNFYLIKRNLDDLNKLDKQFRLYDSINEVFDALNDILNINQASIQKINDNFSISFIFPLPGNKKKEILIPLQFRSVGQKDMTDELIKKIKDLEHILNLEIEENQKRQKIIDENKFSINKLKEENKTLKDECKNSINGLKEEIKILKDEINDLKKWKKEQLEKEENDKKKEKESNIIKNKNDFEFIENRLKLAGNNREIRYKLLYRASRDGDKSEIFHDKCNGINGTLSLVKTTDDLTFGGYTEASWDGSGYKKDEKAFCFSLNLRKIYNVDIPEKAIQPEKKFGPRFANSLFGIKDNSFQNGGWCSYRSDKQYGKIEKAYEITGGKDKFGVKEVEVFQIIFK